MRHFPRFPRFQTLFGNSGSRNPVPFVPKQSLGTGEQMQITKGRKGRQEITYLFAPFSERRRHSGAKRGQGIFFSCRSPKHQRESDTGVGSLPWPIRGISDIRGGPFCDCGFAAPGSLRFHRLLADNSTTIRKSEVGIGEKRPSSRLLIRGIGAIRGQRTFGCGQAELCISNFPASPDFKLIYFFFRRCGSMTGLAPCD